MLSRNKAIGSVVLAAVFFRKSVDPRARLALRTNLPRHPFPHN
jgi:hypothetical protein